MLIKHIKKLTPILTFFIVASAATVWAELTDRSLSSVALILGSIAAPFILCLQFLWNHARIIDLEPPKRRKVAAIVFTLSGALLFAVALAVLFIFPKLFPAEFSGVGLGLLGAGLIYAAEC